MNGRLYYVQQLLKASKLMFVLMLSNVSTMTYANKDDCVADLKGLRLKFYGMLYTLILKKIIRRKDTLILLTYIEEEEDGFVSVKLAGLVPFLLGSHFNVIFVCL